MAQTSVTRETAEAARTAALAVPGVAGLHGGRFGEVAILLPGERIEGLRNSRRSIERGGDNGGEHGVDSDTELGLEVHVVFDVGSEREVQAVATDVREAVLQATSLGFVDVVVADAVRASH